VNKLSTCTPEALAATNNHALVFGRVRFWVRDDGKDDGPWESSRSWWSHYAWWKGHWFPHRGLPDKPHAWTIYAWTEPIDAVYDRNDMELTHWAPLPPIPKIVKKKE
jgi:hypothetical protein